ncbi:aspartate kinase [Balneicella halophila]|uniref:Aspartokinase n=1 Tax=Balneicella halophila TaxID=1537566 RepID=A0A7L4UQ39_BALHA|nr:aspartate kinase [Balneicella halophila]PVX51007.1 aspartate kinase [Balneicella halophila]
MKVFKFGGASINSAARIINLKAILEKEGTEGLVLIVSAMGKTTNKIEHILRCFLHDEDYNSALEKLKSEFTAVASELFPANSIIYDKIDSLFTEMESKLIEYKDKPYNFLYDQVVSYGELITAELIASYLADEGFDNTLLSATEYIVTDGTYRDATVNWSKTCENIKKLAGRETFFITQGFIAGNELGYTTTLGREGSDYTAGIFAYCLDANELTIWKDVIGVLNADPRHFQDTVLLEHVSFNEAIELAYYGASIIHPKTIQPLHRKGIPLKVRSFISPTESGTEVSAGADLVPDVPCYILKQHQQLLKVASKEFSFIVENDISDIFKILCETQMKVNLMHNSAISLSLCIDDRLGDIRKCIDILEENYNVNFIEDVTLYTVRNFCQKDFQKRFGEIKPLLRQRKDNVEHIIIEKDDEN